MMPPELSSLLPVGTQRDHTLQHDHLACVQATKNGCDIRNHLKEGRNHACRLEKGPRDPMYSKWGGRNRTNQLSYPKQKTSLQEKIPSL